MSEERWTIGVDIGGTKIDVAHVDQHGQVQDHVLVATDVKGGYKAVVSQIGKAIQELILRAKSKPLGVGVGMAGQIAPDTGLVLFAPNLNWRNVPLQSDLQNIIKLPVVVTNDVRAATWGEWYHGEGKGCQDLVCLFIGTGVGGGIVSGGKMLTGNNNTAGELGHMVISINGPLCSCGNHGCLEAFAGGRFIGKRAQELAKADPKSGAMLLKLAGGNVDAINAKAVAEAYHSQDPLGLKIIEEVRIALIAGSVNIVNILNPRLLILGGGIINGFPELVSEVEKGVKAQALTAATSSLQVLPTKIQENIGAIGAATLALHI
jgi:glucokinase